MDLSFLRSLLENPGPFLSVYLDVSDHDRGVDAQARQARWRDLREQLAQDDDGVGTLVAVGAALPLSSAAKDCCQGAQRAAAIPRVNAIVFNFML